MAERETESPASTECLMEEVCERENLKKALVAVVALIVGWGSTGPNWPRGILILTGFFTTL